MATNMREVPIFRLPEDVAGRKFGTEDLYEQQDMVLALVHDVSCDACGHLLDELGRRTGEMAGRGASALAIVMGAPPETAGAPGIHRVHDANGQVSAALAWSLHLRPGEAMLLVADRYGGVYSSTPIHGADPAALVMDAIGWIDFVQEQCPECGVPEW